MNEADLKALVADYCNGTLSDDDFQRLQDALRENADARVYFRRYLNLDAALTDVASAEDFAGNAWASATQTHSTSNRTLSSYHVWMSAAAAAIVVLAALILWNLKLQNTKPGDVATNDEETATGFAILTRLIDAEWQEGTDPHVVGDALAAGHLQLASGLAEIEFFSGATVLLEGETDFEIVSAHRAHCHRGRLRAQVPPAARGFTILTPESEVIDLGTEIGIAVGPNGESEVHVFDGEVELHRDNGAPAISLKTGQAVALAADTPDDSLPADAGAFANLDSFAPQSKREEIRRFERWQTYSQTLRQDPRLIVYYPFDQEESGQRRVINAAGDPERRGAMVGARRTNGRWPSKGAAEFRRPGDRIRVFIPGEYSSLTLACWVRLDSVDRMWNSLYLTDGYEQGEVHWQITEEGKLAYSMRIRESGKKQQHLYLSPPFWTPELSGQWIHLATVFDADQAEVIHYLNGREMSREAMPSDCIVTTTRFGPGEIGNWGRSLQRKDPEYVIRSLNGLMDEFAIFSGALPRTEIQAMVAAGSPVMP